jgi:Helix-turn-helix family
MTVALGRNAWSALEPLHAMIYFAPEGPERYGKLGLDPAAGYFASRSAAIGAVSAETVIATFYNFNPDLVRSAIPAAWEHATPEQVLAARHDAVDAALRRGLGDLVASDAVTKAAELARALAEEATEHLAGRPLFAAHAALPWPTEPHLVLWHAQTLIREFRGDGHIAALVAGELNGIEALVTHAATGHYKAETLRKSRQWPEDKWAEAVEALKGRGILEKDEECALTDFGREHRQQIEDLTDRLAEAPFAALGEQHCARLVEVGKPLGDAILAAGMLPTRKPSK